MKNAKDLKLIDCCILGDEDAFTQLYHSHHLLVKKAISSVFSGHVNVHQNTEDATQDTFIRCQLKLHTFQRRCDFHTWLFSIARNIALNMLVRQERTLRVYKEYYSFYTSSYHNPLIAVLHYELATLLQMFCDESLNRGEQRVVYFRERLGYTSSEIAELLDMRVSVVSQQYYAAMQKVQTYLLSLGYGYRKVRCLHGIL